MDIIACLAVIVAELIAIIWLVARLRKKIRFALSSEFSAALISASQYLIVMDALNSSKPENAAAQLEESLDDYVEKLADLLKRDADSVIPDSSVAVEKFYAHVRRLKQARASVGSTRSPERRKRVNMILGLNDGT